MAERSYDIKYERRVEGRRGRRTTHLHNGSFESGGSWYDINHDSSSLPREAPRIILRGMSDLARILFEQSRISRASFKITASIDES